MSGVHLPHTALCACVGPLGGSSNAQANSPCAGLARGPQHVPACPVPGCPSGGVGPPTLPCMCISMPSGGSGAKCQSRTTSQSSEVSREIRSLTAQSLSASSVQRPAAKGQKRVLERKRGNAPLPSRSRRSLRKRVVEKIEDEGVAPGKLARNNKLTRLEQRSISTDSLTQYSQYLSKFKDFCKENDAGAHMDSAEVDRWLADYVDVMFQDGGGAYEGEKTLAAVEFDNISLKGNLVRSRRAVRGWRKLLPATSRLPLPRLLTMSIAMQLCAVRHGRIRHGLDGACGFSFVRSPRRNDRLVQAPRDSTHHHGREPVRVDKCGNQGFRRPASGQGRCFRQQPPSRHSEHAMGGRVLARATSVAGKDARIFDSSMEDFRKKFQQAGAKLGVQQRTSVHESAIFNMFKVRGRWKALIVSALTFLPVVLGSPLLSTKKACRRMQLIWFCFLRIMFLTQLLGREFQVDHGRSCLACMGRRAVYNFLSCP